MASQSSSIMSSATSSTASSASATSNSGGGGSNTMPTGTLPFSFLITFVAVFLFFLGCGFWSRRLSFELRRTLGLPLPSGPKPPIPPALFDVIPYHSVRDPLEKWADMTPLSVAYLRQEPTLTPTPSSSSPAAPHNLEPAAPRLPFHLRILDYIPLFSLFITLRAVRRARASPGTISPETLAIPDAARGPPPPPVRALQVAVLICMPSPDRSRLRRSMDEAVLGQLDGSELGYEPGTGSEKEKEKQPEELVRIVSTTERTSACAEERGRGPAAGSATGAELGECVIGMAEIPWVGGEVSFS